MGLSGNSNRSASTGERRAAHSKLCVGAFLIVLATTVTASAQDDASLKMARIVPRRAVLVVHCPDAERLMDAGSLLSGSGVEEDPILNIVARPLGRLYREFAEGGANGFGVRQDELLNALRGEFLIGWIPRPDAATEGFQPDEWVLIARRLPQTDSAIQKLWHEVSRGGLQPGRIETRRISRASVEQVSWETTREASITPGGQPNMGLPGVDGSRSSAFGEIIRVDRRVLSFAATSGYFLFAPGRAERLDPWIRAIESEGWTGRAGDNLNQLVASTQPAGDLVFAIRGQPSGWIRMGGGGALEKRLGSNPGKVLLSQVREVDCVVRRSGDRLAVDARATILPLPSWVARLVAAFEKGEAFRTASDRCAEVSASIDFPLFWKALHSVLIEGWPAIAGAADSILEPLGGRQGSGMADLSLTLGSNLRLLVFRPEKGSPLEPLWAIRIDLADPTGFAQFEARIARLLGLFSLNIERYQALPDGQLRKLAPPTTATLPTNGPRLYTAYSDTHFVAAAGQTALRKALRPSKDAPGAAANSTGQPELPLPGAGAPALANAAAVTAYYEAHPAADAGMMLDGRLRRRIRTREGTIDVVSPPPEQPRPGTGDKFFESELSDPIAKAVAAVFIEAEDRLRIQLNVRFLKATPPSASPGATPRPPTGSRPKEPSIEN